MTTADVEPVAGPSHATSHVMQMMTSQPHLYPSQHLQPTTVCLPVSVQHLSYDDDDFVDDETAAAAHVDDDDNDDDDDDDDERTDDDDELQSININSDAGHWASTPANVSLSAAVRSHLLKHFSCCCCDSPAALFLSSVDKVEENCSCSRVVPLFPYM